jgi:carbonic anhydrase
MSKFDRALRQLVANNQKWAADMVADDPDYFKKLVSQQNPEFLWIGCSDSRVPANEIVGMQPGELFVHRNVANVVVHSDLNSLSVLQFAIDVLGIKHVIVVGHYGCSGVHAAMERRRVGLADNWLRHVQDVHIKHAEFLPDSLSPKVRGDRLCELNVIEQVINVCQTTIVQDAWGRGQDLTVHSWVYSLEDGLVRDLGLAVSDFESLTPQLEKVFSRYAGLVAAEST